MHLVIRRLSAEKTFMELRDYIAPFSRRRQKVFDRDVLEELKPLIEIYHERFIGNRKMPFIARLLCYHLYFKKKIQDLSQKDPLSRHVLLKTFKENNVLGLLISINLWDNESLKKQQLLEIIKGFLPDLQEVEDALLVDMVDQKFPIFYLELKKGDHSPFSPEEVFGLERNYLKS